MATTELSADTRARILDAAWRRVREHGTGAVSVKAIAAGRRASRASSSTSTTATAPACCWPWPATTTRRAASRGRSRAARDLPPVAALEALLRAWCAYLPEMLPGARALEAALITGDEGGEVWLDRMDDLHAVFDARRRARRRRRPARARLDRRDRRRLGLGARPARRLGPPRPPPRLDRRGVHRAHRRDAARRARRTGRLSSGTRAGGRARRRSPPPSAAHAGRDACASG